MLKLFALQGSLPAIVATEETHSLKSIAKN